MSTTYELMERIQKYEPVEKFLILNKNGNKLNSELKEEEKGKNVPNNFNSNYSDIPKLVEKAISVARDINPIVKHIFYFIARIKFPSNQLFEL
jgi:hypothetical protein